MQILFKKLYVFTVHRCTLVVVANRCSCVCVSVCICLCVSVVCACMCGWMGVHEHGGTLNKHKTVKQ